MNDATEYKLSLPRRESRRGFGKLVETRRGFALIVVLMLLTMTTILAVAFAFTMRTERVVSANMVSGQKADMIAHNALNHAISLLANNIPDPKNPATVCPPNEARGWFTHPGRLTIFDSDPATPDRHVDLYTGVSTAKPENGFDLNSQSPVTLKYPITGAANQPMWVAWKNVLEDNTEEPGINNQMVGRYAFWIDDESTKLNFNTARGKPADTVDKVLLPSTWRNQVSGRDMIDFLTPRFDLEDSSGVVTNYALGQPQSVNLDLKELNLDIPALQANFAKRKQLTVQQFFTNPEDIKFFAKGNADSTFEEAKFYVTPFSRAPEFNVFGKSRLMILNTIGDLATSPAHQHFTHPTEPMVFWGSYAGVGNNTSANAFNMGYLRRPTVEAMADYLNRSDWPSSSTASSKFSGKRFRWTATPTDLTGMAESDQIALNISNMGYWGATSAGSTTNYINYMVRWMMYGGYKIPDPPAVSANKGLVRGPLSNRPTLPPYFGPQITEITCTLTPEPGGNILGNPSTRLKFGFSYEVYMPPGYYVRGDTGVKKFSNDSSSGGNYELMMSPSLIQAIVDVDNNVVIDAAGNKQKDQDSNLNFTTAQDKSQRNKTPAQSYSDSFEVVTPPALQVGVNNSIRLTTDTNNKYQYLGDATVKIRLRYGIWPRNKGTFVQAIPVPVPALEVGSDPDMQGPNGDDSQSYLEFTFNGVNRSSATRVISYEVSDPRLTGRKDSWLLYPYVGQDSMGEPNITFQDNPETPVIEKDLKEEANQIASWNFDMGAAGREGSPASRATSIGMFSLIPTGMQRGVVWDTLRFYKYDYGGDLPDWVLLDLLAPVFPNPASRAHSTAGKINLNSRIYPMGEPTFNPPIRVYPTRALFQNMPNGAAAAESVLDWQKQADNNFDYVGRLCDIPNVADEFVSDSALDLEFDKEALIRNLAGLVTTQSNTFGVWGVAQSMKKKRGNTNYGSYDKGDAITGQRRFYAVVERYVWQGREGIAGNAYVDTSGQYTLTADVGLTPGAPAKVSGGFWTANKWAVMDGPQEPVINTDAMGTMPYSKSKLEEANNPIGPVMKYRIIHMQYVD